MLEEVKRELSNTIESDNENGIKNILFKLRTVMQEEVRKRLFNAIESSNDQEVKEVLGEFKSTLFSGNAGVKMLRELYCSAILGDCLVQAVRKNSIEVVSLVFAKIKELETIDKDNIFVKEEEFLGGWFKKIRTTSEVAEFLSMLVKNDNYQDIIKYFASRHYNYSMTNFVEFKKDTVVNFVVRSDDFTLAEKFIKNATPYVLEVVTGFCNCGVSTYSTPLMEAVKVQNLCMVNALIEAGAKVNTIARKGVRSDLDFNLQSNDPRCIQDGGDAITLAVTLGNVKIIECLVDAGANPNREIQEGGKNAFKLAQEGHNPEVRAAVFSKERRQSAYEVMMMRQNQQLEKVSVLESQINKLQTDLLDVRKERPQYRLFNAYSKQHVSSRREQSNCCVVQ